MKQIGTLAERTDNNMNRSNLMPESGKRYKLFKKLSKIISCVIFSATILSFLGYSAVSDKIDRYSATEEKNNQNISLPEPTRDELEAGASEIPEEYREFYYENEYPIALGIYDTLFSEEEQPTTIPDGELKIIKTDLSKNPSAGTVYLKNNTSYSITAADYLSADELSLPASSKPISEVTEPKVLIYHTHGTEAYAEEGKTSYAKSALPRSKDITKNVVAVGKVLADTLNENGVPTVHCEIMHDEKSYNNSYTYSRKTILEYMEKYPSIEYVFDIHRDALLNSSSVYKVLTYDESIPVAQIMLVVGTDSAGAVHPNWRKNLSFAVDAQYLLTKRLENIVRPICIKKASYNQQHCEGAMLIEIGTCVNTLNEAKASAKILGQTLASLINAESAG